MTIKYVIPARLSSQRLPRKPLLLIGGKPMICHVFDRIIESGVNASDVFVATDDQEVVDAVSGFGLNVLLTSVDHQSGTDRIYEVSQKLNWSDAQVIINVQGDEPLIPIQLLAEFKEFVSVSKSPVNTVCTKISSQEDFLSRNVVKVVLSDLGNALYFSRSNIPCDREDPTSYQNAKKHIGIYSYTVESLRRFVNNKSSALELIEKLEQLRFLSNETPIGVFQYSESVVRGVDTESDYIFVKDIIEGRVSL